MATKPPNKHRKRPAPRVVVVAGLPNIEDFWQPNKLLALASKVLNYEWSLDHEVNRVPLDSKDDYLSLQSSAWSVPWKLGLAHYHAGQSLAAIPAVIPEDAPDKSTMAAVLMYAAMSYSKEGEPFAEAMLMTEAHAIAAAQALHSVIDIFVDVIYIALRLNEIRAIPERHRSLQNVARLVKHIDERLSTDLEAVQTSEVFRYLSAYVNTTKHRRLVDHHFTQELVDSRRFGLRFVPFRYEFGENDVAIFPSKWTDDFMRESLAFMSETITRIGQELEALLAARASDH